MKPNYLILLVCIGFCLFVGTYCGYLWSINELNQGSVLVACGLSLMLCANLGMAFALIANNRETLKKVFAASIVAMLLCMALIGTGSNYWRQHHKKLAVINSTSSV